MTLADLIALCRLEIPEILSSDVISDTNLKLLINNGAREFINKTDALPTYKLFDLVLNLLEYPLSTYITDYGKPRKQGLWFYNVVSGKWIQLEATTLPYLATNYPSYLNTASSNPLRFSIDGDLILVHPPASSTYVGTEYLKLFYYARSVDMTSNTNYPFSGSDTVHFTHLADYEEMIVEYVRWRIKRIFKKGSDAEEAKTLFYTMCVDVKVKLQSRPDLIPWQRTNYAGGMNVGNMFNG
jgi:hypothetical protein